jgi:unsaturated rhamnogalacturonyl hydrolase
MPFAADQVEVTLASLVKGMAGLRADGRFHEPNLDGTPGDYVSFDSWEWPQGVGLYSLVKLWKQTGNPALLKTVEDWYDRRIAAGLPEMNVNTTAPMLALSELWRAKRQPRFAGVLDEWANRVVATAPRTPSAAPSSTMSPTRSTMANCGTTRCSWRRCSWRVTARPPAERRTMSTRQREQFLHACAHYLADTRDRPLVPWLDVRRPPQFCAALAGPAAIAWVTVCILDLMDHGGAIDAPVRDFLNSVSSESQIETLLKLQAPFRRLAHAAGRSRLLRGNLRHRRVRLRADEGGAAGHRAEGLPRGRPEGAEAVC